MNLLYRNIRVSLGNLNLKNTRQSCTISILDVRNSFIRTRFTVKSRERKSALFNGHTSRAYRRTGMHLLLTNCKNTNFNMLFLMVLSSFNENVYILQN